MSKSKILIFAVIVIAMLAAGCGPIKQMQDPGYGISDHMQMPPGDLAYMPYDEIPYIPWDAFPYFPWDEFAYIPWHELPYLPWENIAYLPWDVYPYFPWDDLPYFPWDEVPYLPGDEIPYLTLPDWVKTLTPPWEFIDIGCPNMRTVAVTIKTDLLDNPKITAEDCDAKYKCVPIDGKPGWYYCTADKPIYNAKNCPIKVCVQKGRDLICQEIDPGVFIDCPYEIQMSKTPEVQAPFCSQFTDATSCRLNNYGCVWNTNVKPARCDGP